MNPQNPQGLTRMDQAIANLIRIGTITNVDYGAATCIVKDGDLETPMIPFPSSGISTGDIFGHSPEPGQQVVFACPSGDVSQAVVIAYLYAGNVPTGEAGIQKTAFSNGTTVSYDRNSNAMDISLAGGGTTNITSTGGVNIVGDVAVTGNISASGDIADKTRSMQADRDIYNKHHHNAMPQPPTELQ